VPSGDIVGGVADVAPSAAFVSLIASAVAAVWRGWLVPRRSVDQLITVQNERLAEARDREREWRAAWEASEEARRIIAERFDDMLEGQRTVEALIRALPTTPPYRPGGGGGA
jgi:hypothetical protein